MRLGKLAACLSYAVIQSPQPPEQAEVAGIAYDSRKAEPGFLFVCIRGEKADGHAYIGEACGRGARFVMVEKLVLDGEMLAFPPHVTVLLVKDTREALAYVSAAWFRYPAAKLQVIGVTGTKGKTTVTHMIREMLEAAGHPAGLIGTNGCRIGGEIISSVNTTPESFTIQEYFAKMVETGCEYAVMEVSSQGVRQKRIEGIRFAVGVFTNFSEDHVGPGEHGSVGEYRYYKSLLFRQCSMGIGNLDDLECRYMFRRTSCGKYGFTCQGKGGDLERVLGAEDIRFCMANGVPETRFTAAGRAYRLEMPGLFSVCNALAAIQTLRCLGIRDPRADEALEKVQVRGRMERIPNEKNVACYIDYAHNKASLTQVLTTLRIYRPRRIILVFGCGGNRAKSRRREMGETAGRLADLTILTTDNPRFEEPEAILAEILEGMKRTEGRYRVIPDRREAVTEALREAEEGDVVLIAGKGHETYQEIAGVRYPLDDRELVRGEKKDG